MFCKRCHKFNMTEECIYCGFHNDGNYIRKEPKAELTEISEVENLPIENDIPEVSPVEAQSKAKLLKILNIVAISVFGLAIVLNLLLFFRYRLFGGYAMLSMLSPLLYSLAAIPCILYLCSNKYRNKFSEKTHLSTTIACLAIAVYLLLTPLMPFILRRFNAYV